jgi:hypothetical protein
MREMFEIMREAIAKDTKIRAQIMADLMRQNLAGVEVLGADSNEALSSGAQIVAAQVKVLVERMEKRAGEMHPNVATNTDFLVEMLTEILVDVSRRVAVSLAVKSRD